MDPAVLQYCNTATNPCHALDWPPNDPNDITQLAGDWLAAGAGLAIAPVEGAWCISAAQGLFMHQKPAEEVPMGRPKMMKWL
jgi:hypothetical protein